MNSTQIMRLAVAAILGLVWLAIVWFGKTTDPGMGEILTGIKYILAWLVGHMMGDKGDGSLQRPVPDKLSIAQAGFSTPRFLTLLAGMIIGLCMLAGCTTTTATLYAGWETAAKKGVQAADDNLVTTLHDAWCGLPYSALQRQSAATQQSVQVLCGPLNVGGLDANQIATLLQLTRTGTLMLAPAPGTK
jgi:hypothetical protein